MAVTFLTAVASDSGTSCTGIETRPASVSALNSRTMSPSAHSTYSVMTSATSAESAMSRMRMCAALAVVIRLLPSAKVMRLPSLSRAYQPATL